MGQINANIRSLVTRAMIALLLVAGIQAPALAASETNPSAAAMTADLLVARPLGVVMTIVGSAVFVVSLPFSAAGGNLGEAADKLVVAPAKETFVRCLGCTRPGRAQAAPEQ